MLPFVSTVTFVIYFSTLRSKFPFSNNPISILEIFALFISTISVTPTFLTCPSILTSFNIASEFKLLLIPSFWYDVNSYLSVSYSNNTKYFPFATLLNVYSPLLFVVVLNVLLFESVTIEFVSALNNFTVIPSNNVSPSSLWPFLSESIHATPFIEYVLLLLLGLSGVGLSGSGFSGSGLSGFGLSGSGFSGSGFSGSGFTYPYGTILFFIPFDILLCIYWPVTVTMFSMFLNLSVRSTFAFIVAFNVSSGYIYVWT